jgi:superoxide dismutase, Fe-Mn family
VSAFQFKNKRKSTTKMLRRSTPFFLSASSSSSTIVSEYIPQNIPGRDWKQQRVYANSNQRESANLIQQQKELFFSTPSAKTPSKSSSRIVKEQRKRIAAQETNNFRETEAAVAFYESTLKPAKGYYHLPQIDYSIADGIAPLISKTQAQLLHDVYHRGIVDQLNKLTLGTIYEAHPLDAVILSTSFDAENAAIHTAACEHWNHSFVWKSMIPFGSAPSSRMKEILTTSTVKQRSTFASLDIENDNTASRARALQHAIDSAASGNSGFDKVKRMLIDACMDSAATGGGWVFLVTTQAGLNFEVIRYRPGNSPIASQLIPLVGINMQLHARIVDYIDDSAVKAYIEKSIQTINWKLAERLWSNVMHGGEE